MTSQNGRSIHAQAEHAREDGEFLQALKFTDEAMLAYSEDKDLAGFAEILASRFLTLRHLSDSTGDKNFLIIAKHTVMSSVEIAEKSADQSATALPKFNLAKIHEELGELDEAIKVYKEAISIMKANAPKEHDRPAVIFDMENHLSVAEYKNGDQSAEQRAITAIESLRATNEPQYTKDVWMSGGYMRLAEATKNKEYLTKAQEIIDANEELVLRKKQLEKLSQKLA